MRYNETKRTFDGAMRFGQLCDSHFEPTSALNELCKITEAYPQFELMSPMAVT
jgi:hypothetical protein